MKPVLGFFGNVVQTLQMSKHPCNGKPVLKHPVTGQMGYLLPMTFYDFCKMQDKNNKKTLIVSGNSDRYIKFKKFFLTR